MEDGEDHNLYNIQFLITSVLAFLEKKRIKLHLMRTEYWMIHNTRHGSHLQNQNRTQILKILKRYWKNERFPINTTHAKKIPQIKDQKGTMCALAYILHNSGERSLVEDLARNNNYALVNDIPDDHPLMDAIATRGISKKEAAKIQPNYACNVMLGKIQAEEPIIAFFGIILSIVGLSIALSFFWGLNHVSYNISRKTIILIIILGMGVAIIGFGTTMTYQKSMVEPVDFDFIGTYGSVHVTEDTFVHYWIDGGVVERGWTVGSFAITPDRDGQITVAYPSVLTSSHIKIFNLKLVNDYYERFQVWKNNELVDHPSYKLNGYIILKVPFSEHDSSIKITFPRHCAGFNFVDKMYSNP